MSSNTNIIFKNYQYTLKNDGKKAVTYYCSYHRSTKCDAKIKILKCSGAKPILIGSHNEVCLSRNAITNPIPPEKNTNPCPDFTIDMKKFIEEEALADLSIVPSIIWKKLCDKFSGITAYYTGLTKAQAMNYVYSVRRANAGGSDIQKLEMESMSNRANSFLRFNHSFADYKKKQRIMGFANPELLHLLKYPKVHLFGDATFRCCPKPFEQCYILMVFDKGTMTFVPVMYILMTGRTEDCYFHALHMVLHEADWCLDPASFGLDFEMGEINAVNCQFPNAKKDGCFFHWKQALRRKMVDLGIDKQQMKMALKEMDLLTVIPKEEVASKGIPFVRIIIEENLVVTADIAKWKPFWEYFDRFWMKEKNLDMWNMVDKIEDDEDHISRTNNALERYNHHINGVFPSKHPNLLAFAKCLEDESKRVALRLDNIRKGREMAPKYPKIPFPAIPREYKRFQAPPSWPRK